MAINTEIFKYEAKFVAGASSASQLPKAPLPQIAFIGKSNVGKSSLINKICRRKQLARTSHTPGRTRQINFFSLADKFFLSDLPGYGFAKVPIAEKASWERLIMHYLQNTQQAQLIYLLIDARHGIKPNDIAIIRILDSYKKNFQLVFTKSDKQKINDEFINNIKNTLATLSISCNLFFVSSRTGQGVRDIQADIVRFVNSV